MDLDVVEEQGAAGNEAYPVDAVPRHGHGDVLEPDDVRGAGVDGHAGAAGREDAALGSTAVDGERLGDGDRAEAARVQHAEHASRGSLGDGPREGLARRGAAARIGIVANAGHPGAGGLCPGAAREETQGQREGWPVKDGDAHVTPPMTLAGPRSGWLHYAAHPPRRPLPRSFDNASPVADRPGDPGPVGEPRSYRPWTTSGASLPLAEPAPFRVNPAGSAALTVHCGTAAASDGDSSCDVSFPWPGCCSCRCPWPQCPRPPSPSPAMRPAPVRRWTPIATAPSIAPKRRRRRASPRASTSSIATTMAA